MLKVSTLVAIALVAAQAALADSARITDRAGRWICVPDNPAWPQILIDFEEDAYRRCDQNTCVTYPIQEIAPQPHGVRIVFAPASELRTGVTGGIYRETIMVGSHRAETRGSCMFRDEADLYLPESSPPPR